jgi:hypothetical protein
MFVALTALIDRHLWRLLAVTLAIVASPRHSGSAAAST